MIAICRIVWVRFFFVAPSLDSQPRHCDNSTKWTTFKWTLHEANALEFVTKKKYDDDEFGKVELFFFLNNERVTAMKKKKGQIDIFNPFM